MHSFFRRAFVHDVPAQNDRVRLGSGDFFGVGGKVGGRHGIFKMQIGEEDDGVSGRRDGRAAVNDLRARRDRVHIPKSVGEEKKCA